MVITVCSFHARLPQGGGVFLTALCALCNHTPVCAVPLWCCAPPVGRPGPAPRRGRSRRVVRRASSCPDAPCRAAPTRPAPPHCRLPEFLRFRDRSAWVSPFLRATRASQVFKKLQRSSSKGFF